MSGFFAKLTKNGVLRRFGNDKSGGVAILFGLSFIPIIGLTGAAIDYGRASQLRSRIASASDAAALAAAKAPNLTVTERDALARSVFNANTADIRTMTGINFRVSSIASGVRVDVSAESRNNFLPVIGRPTTSIDVYSEVARGDGYVEVALVLDNTGSMRADIDGLKRASKSFTNTLFGSGMGAGSLKMSVVPYVAAVNPGVSNMGMTYMDARGEGPHHAQAVRGIVNGAMIGCDPYPRGGRPTGGGSDDGDGGDGAWLQDVYKKFAAIGQELLGIKSAAALGETPNTRAPLSGTWVSPGAPYVTRGERGFLPTGFGYDGVCYMTNPSIINHFDLFDRIPSARWGGCVEARPEPYDVTDDAPTADARTKFVPYFWPDELGKRGVAATRVERRANNYMDDGVLPSGWSFEWENSWEKDRSILKYNGVTPATMNDSLGPNKACPDELLRLTTTKADIIAKLDNMKAYDGGGTISSEGVAWGWRTLSPKAPFADGRAYGSAKKFLVLMSDGENSIGESNKDGGFISHYSAYGVIRDGRFPAERFARANKYLDDRFELACSNAKAAGITVMTVYFRDNNASAKNMMRRCASAGQFFYEAVDEAGLTQAFSQIASEIGKLRITK
jgi:Flp pilus assembly protein TadG